MRYAFKKARALRINNLETDELEVRLVDLKTVTWTNGQETVYAEMFADATHISVIFLLAGTFIANYAFCAQGHVQLIEVSNSEPASLTSGDFWYEVLS